MVTLYFKTDVSEKGPGTWIHNNLLLCEDSYRKKIIELIDKENERILYNTSILVWWDNLKYKYEYESEKCRGAILRSKAQWANESNKCTKYFLQLEKARQESNTKKELVNDKGIIHSNVDSIMNMQYHFVF